MPTTNSPYNLPYPDDFALVKNGAGAIEALAKAVARELAKISAPPAPEQEDWKTLGSGAKYRRAGNVVTLDFDNASGTVGTLPEGYRPEDGRWLGFAVPLQSSNTSTAKVEVQSGGTVKVLDGAHVKGSITFVCQ